MPEHGLRNWFRERPIWLQDVARKLFDGEGFTPDELAESCIQEALGNLGNPEFVLPGGLFGDGTANSLRLTSIHDIQGINALSPKNPLSFGDNNLAVVYGLNGSGKSGYVRILKHACGARHPGVLHQNVFSGGHKEQKCEIAYEKDDSIIQHKHRQ